MTEQDTQIGTLIGKVDEMSKKLDCLPNLCERTAVNETEIAELKRRADTNSIRGWQVTLAAIGSAVSMLFASIALLIKGGR